MSLRQKLLLLVSFTVAAAVVAVAWTVLWIGLSIIAHIPIFGWLTVLIWPLISLAGLILWVILLLKANQHQMYKLPVIGDMAEKQANAM